jgi:hypothetical protein
VVLHSVSFIYNDIIPLDFRQHIFVFNHIFVSCQKDVESRRNHSILIDAFSDRRSSFKYDFRHFGGPTIKFEFPICNGSEKTSIAMSVLFCALNSCSFSFHQKGSFFSRIKEHTREEL